MARPLPAQWTGNVMPECRPGPSPPAGLQDPPPRTLAVGRCPSRSFWARGNGFPLSGLRGGHFGETSGQGRQKGQSLDASTGLAQVTPEGGLPLQPQVLPGAQRPPEGLRPQLWWRASYLACPLGHRVCRAWVTGHLRCGGREDSRTRLFSSWASLPPCGAEPPDPGSRPAPGLACSGL